MYGGGSDAPVNKIPCHAANERLAIRKLLKFAVRPTRVGGLVPHSELP